MKKIKYSFKCYNCGTKWETSYGIYDLVNYDYYAGVVVYQKDRERYNEHKTFWGSIFDRNPNPYTTIKCKHCEKDTIKIVGRKAVKG